MGAKLGCFKDDAGGTLTARDMEHTNGPRSSADSMAFVNGRLETASIASLQFVNALEFRGPDGVSIIVHPRDPDFAFYLEQLKQEVSTHHDVLFVHCASFDICK